MLSSIKKKKSSSIKSKQKKDAQDSSTKSLVSIGETAPCSQTESSEFNIPSSELLLNSSSLSLNSFTSKPSSYSSKRNTSSEIDRRLMRTSVVDLSKTKVMQELTINKLRYDKIGLVGREEEIQTLQDCLERMTLYGENKELVFIKGYEGTGKSKLAISTLETQTKKLNGMLVRGKIAFNNDGIPYSGIAEAFGEICRSIKNTLGFVEKEEEEETTDDEDGTDMLTAVGESLLTELGSEMIQLLAKLVPELLALIPTSSATDLKEVTNDRDDLDAGLERWKYSFRQLAKVFNSYIAPLILVMDDLQWADGPSLEVIDYLISDFTNENEMMIIGCYRSNQVDNNEDDHILIRKINDLEGKKGRFKFNMTHIELGSLKVDDVNKIIMSLLAIDDEEETQGLAEISYKRTNGNPFFLNEFMTMLKEERLIDFNIGLMKWMWDDQAVEDGTMSTANVVDLLQARMKKLPEDVQLLLRHAACLGAAFKLSTLELVWSEHAATTTNEGELGEVLDLLDILEGENFVENCGSGVSDNNFRMTHDKVKEAALSLDASSMNKFQNEVGVILNHSLSEEELEESLFDVVDLINKGDIKRSREYSKLNLRAAQKAKSISAFQSAAIYVANGINLLPNNKWTPSERELSLQLYTLGAQLELALGHVEEMEMYSNEVLSQKDISTLDKIPVYITKVNKLCNVERKYEDALKFCLEVLDELDCKLVRNKFLLPFMAMGSFIRTSKRAQITPRDVIENRTVMTDPKEKAAMDFLTRVGYACYLTGNDLLFVLSAAIQVQKTMKYGLGELGGVAYCNIGLLTVAIFKNFESAKGLADTAITMNRHYGGHSEATVVHIANATILPWTQLLQSIDAPLKQAYLSGMRSGNTEFAMWAAFLGKIVLRFVRGNPLNGILEVCPTIFTQAGELGQHEHILWLKIVWQMMMNLAGQSNERKLLMGEIFDCETFSGTANNEAVINFAKMNLLVIFGDYKSAADLALKVGDSFGAANPGLFLGMRETYLRGAALYAMAVKTKKRKYKSAANKVRKTLKTWLKNGNPNVKHYFSLLSAEQASLNKNFNAAEEHFKEAIVFAARTGHMHDAALFNERYANFLRNELNDEDEAKYRINEAIRYYEEWGAHGKVQLLHLSLGLF